jgi:hypothetical protein
MPTSFSVQALELDELASGANHGMRKEANEWKMRGCNFNLIK